MSTSLTVNTEQGDIRIVRTGRIYGIASSEFMIVYPDKEIGILWSPVWNEWGKKMELDRAGKKALDLWKNHLHVNRNKHLLFELINYLDNYKGDDGCEKECLALLNSVHKN